MIHAARKVGRHRVRDSAIILLMFRHGLRTAELVALKWSQIDLTGGYIEVHRVKQGHDSIHPLLPSFRELDRQVNHVRTRVNQTLFSETIKRLNPELSQSLNDLLLSQPSENLTPFNQLKALPKRPSRNHLNDLLAHEQWLSHDNLTEMFLKRMATIHKKAQDKLEQIKQQYQQTSDQLLSTFQEVLQVLSDEDKPETPQELLQAVESTLTASGGVQKLLSQCEAVTAYKSNNYYPLLWGFYQSHRAAIFD
jgi:hypothetical protein